MQKNEEEWRDELNVNSSGDNVPTCDGTALGRNLDQRNTARFGDFLFSFEFNMGCETKDVSILHFCVFYMAKIC